MDMTHLRIVVVVSLYNRAHWCNKHIPKCSRKVRGLWLRSPFVPVRELFPLSL